MSYVGRNGRGKCPYGELSAEDVRGEYNLYIYIYRTPGLFISGVQITKIVTTVENNIAETLSMSSVRYSLPAG